MDSPLRVVELFAGIGAQATALENLGIPHECIISETDPHAIAMYEAMHGKTENLGDIRLVEHLPDCDLATWTFPCQSISIAGHMEGMVEGSGSKSSLGWEAIRLFRDAVERERQPKFLLMENVRAILSKKNKGEFKRMVDALSDIGYTSTWGILKAKDFGIPQFRPRCFLLSVFDHDGIQLPKGTPTDLRILDFLEPEVDESFYLSEDRIAVFERHRHRQEENGRGFGWRPLNPRSPRDRIAKTVTTNPDRYVSTWILETDSTDSGAEIIVSGRLNRPNYHDYNNRVYGVDGIAPTLPAHSGGDTVPKIDLDPRVRYLTPRECWRLMGFDDERIDRAFAVEPSKTARYKAAGNSIVVPVLEAIFSQILSGFSPNQTILTQWGCLS